MLQINEGQEIVGEKDNNEEPPSTSPQVSAEARSSSPKQKKAKSLINAVKDLKHLHASINATVDDEDSFDAFGNSVAKQLRKLSEERALLAQSAIQNLLTDYGIQDLREKKQRSQSTLAYDNHHHLSGASTPSSYFVPSPSLSSTPQYQSSPQSSDSYSYTQTSQSAMSQYQTLPQSANSASEFSPTDSSDKLVSLISATFN